MKSTFFFMKPNGIGPRVKGVRAQISRPIGLVMLLLFSQLLMACTRVAPSPAEAAMLSQGETVYQTHCAACHGLEGEGQPDWRRPGPNGRLPAPPHNSDGHTWHHPDQQLLHIIANGSILPNSDMPAYGDILTQEEMEAVLAYIKTFWGSAEREYQQNITDQY